MKAYLKNYRQAPRKVRLVADSVRGKRVDVALDQLSLMTLKAAPAVRKLIQSAFANARQQDTLIQPTDCVVRTIMVDKGMTYQRFMPRAFGRASAIHRESSHVRLELGKVEAKEEVVKQARA